MYLLLKIEQRRQWATIGKACIWFTKLIKERMSTCFKLQNEKHINLWDLGIHCSINKEEPYVTGSTGNRAVNLIKNRSVRSSTRRCGSIKRTTEMATPNGDMSIVLHMNCCINGWQSHQEKKTKLHLLRCNVDLVSIAEAEKQGQLLQEASVCGKPEIKHNIVS